MCTYPSLSLMHCIYSNAMKFISLFTFFSWTPFTLFPCPITLIFSTLIFTLSESLPPHLRQLGQRSRKWLLSESSERKLCCSYSSQGSGISAIHKDRNLYWLVLRERLLFVSCNTSISLISRLACSSVPSHGQNNRATSSTNSCPS